MPATNQSHSPVNHGHQNKTVSRHISPTLFCGSVADYLISSPPGEPFPVYAVLSNGKVYGCDMIVSATGVTPNTSFVGDISEVCVASLDRC